MLELWVRNIRVLPLRIKFKKRDLAKLPEHWQTYGTRHSLINLKANHNATNPANAMLNYRYALLYSETRLALMRAGLDTTAEIFHAGSTKRESFVTDVMEAVRSDVDLWLFEYIKDHSFSAKEFYEKKDGGVWLKLKQVKSLIK